MQIHIVSSIPPKLRGINLLSCDTESLQFLVLQSWRNLTDSIHSVHTTHELSANPDHQHTLSSCGCSKLVVRDSFFPNQTLLPSIRDLLSSILEARLNGLIIITNADIIFNNPKEIRGLAGSMNSNQAAFARRFNVNLLNDTCDGSLDNAGFDFFAFHSDALKPLISFCPEVLRFGIPWWDLYLPLIFLASGLTARYLADHNHFIHINHEDRWNREEWFRVGIKSYNQFVSLLAAQNKSDLLTTVTNSYRTSMLSDFSSLLAMYRGVRCQVKYFIKHKSTAPFHLFSFAESINQILEQDFFSKLNP